VAKSLCPTCVECGLQMPSAHIHKMYCSRRCKGRYRKKHPHGSLAAGHACRMCGKRIKLHKGQGNKWLCSSKCRRASTALSVRTFHERRPRQEAIYRARTKEKRLPNGNLHRFYRTNPNAPHACECCGEKRVLDVAHKPHAARLGEWRSSKNCKWPSMVWVLCPTCHALLDRMHYPPSDLGLVI